MDKRKILVLSLLSLGVLGTPAFSQNVLTVTNMSVYTIPVLNFTYNGTYGANVFAVSHYTYNDTPYILAVLGTNYPISVNLFNITGGLIATQNISDLIQNLTSQGYSLGNIFIYEYNDTAYIDIPFYKYLGSFYTGSYTSLYLYQITVNGNNISSPQLVSNASISGKLSNIYFINTPQNTSYIITSTGIYSPNGTALLSLAAPIASPYLHILPTANNIYIDYSYYEYNNSKLFSLADINLNTGQLYIFYNNNNTLYGFTVFVSTYYPNDYVIAVDTPDRNDLIVNTTMYSLSSTFCTTSAGVHVYIYNNYFGMFGGGNAITFDIFNITNNTLYCFPYSYNSSSTFIIPNLSIGIPITAVIYSVTPIYYNGSDIFLLVPAIDSGYLFDINLTNLTVGYTSFAGFSFTGACTADNYLIICSNSGNTTIYVVSGQPLTPTPTQIYYTVPTQTCYPQQFNYTNFTAYLLHIFNVTFDQSSLSGVNVYSIYPYTYNNSPYILAIVGTVYPQLVSLFNITGGLIATQNISDLIQNLTSQGYSLGNIFIYEYNDTAYIDIPFSLSNNYLLYEMTVTGDNISYPQLVSAVYGFDTPYYGPFFAKVANYTIFGGTFFNTSLGQVRTLLNITQNNTTVIYIDSGYSYPSRPMRISYPPQAIETKDYVYLAFVTGKSTDDNLYLFLFAINKATGQIYTLVNGTMISNIGYPIQSDYYNDVIGIPMVNTVGKQVSILIIGNVSTIVPESNILVDGNYVIGYSTVPNYNNTQYTCINMNIYNYTVQGDNIILNLVNQSSILDTFGSNISSVSWTLLYEAGYTPIAFLNDSNIYSLLYLGNLSFIRSSTYFQSEAYGLYNELGISPSLGQYSYIQIIPVYSYYFLNFSTGTYVRIAQSCSQKGYLIMCTTSNTNTSTTETDIYVLSALNLTPTPVYMLLTTPTAPLQYTIPTQTSAPSPSPTPSPTPTTTAVPTTSAPSVSVPAGYSTTAQSTVSIPPYSIFVAIVVGAALVGWYYARKKYLG